MYDVHLILVLAEAPHAPSIAEALRAWHEESGTVTGTSWPLEISLPEDGLQIQVAPSELPELHPFQFARSLLDEETQARVARATSALAITISGTDMLPMAFLGLGLGAVRPLLSNVLAVVDIAASSVQPGGWAESVADTPVPPRPESLFSLHAVGEEDGRRWIHSHGLGRFGLPEIEALEVPSENATVVAHLLNTVATRMLLEGPPETGETVAWGNSIHAALVPYDRVRDLASTGGLPDERDEAHCTDNLVLVHGDETGWQNIATEAPNWGEHPVLYRSDWETRRAEALSAIRWPLAAQMFPFLVGSHREDFMFMVKIAYAPPEGVREHLWFRVEEAGSSSVVATLLNEPHQDIGFGEGDTREHALENLSDFVVFTPFGRFNPETLPELASWLGRQLDASPES